MQFRLNQLYCFFLKSSNKDEETNGNGCHELNIQNTLEDDVLVKKNFFNFIINILNKLKFYLREIII